MTDDALLGDEKKFYERFWALHRDPVLVSIVKKFGIAALRRSSVLEGFEAFVKAESFTGRRCVEIGTLNGLTAIVLARYFDEVVSIDIAVAPDRDRIARHAKASTVRFVTVADNAEKSGGHRRPRLRCRLCRRQSCRRHRGRLRARASRRRRAVP